DSSSSSSSSSSSVPSPPVSSPSPPPACLQILYATLLDVFHTSPSRCILSFSGESACGLRVSLWISSAEFEGLPLLARSRKVQKVLADLKLMGGGNAESNGDKDEIHAITLKCLTESEWLKRAEMGGEMPTADEWK